MCWVTDLLTVFLYSGLTRNIAEAWFQSSRQQSKIRLITQTLGVGRVKSTWVLWEGLPASVPSVTSEASCDHSTPSGKLRLSPGKHFLRDPRESYTHSQLEKSSVYKPWSKFPFQYKLYGPRLWRQQSPPRSETEPLSTGVPEHSINKSGSHYGHNSSHMIHFETTQLSSRKWPQHPRMPTWEFLNPLKPV